MRTRHSAALALVVLAALAPAQFSTTITQAEKDAAAKQAQAAPAADPKVDRSGEAKLKTLFERYGKLGDSHLSVVRYDLDGDHMTRGADLDFYRAADGRWRFAASTYWSDSFLAVGGKEAVLVDELTSRPQLLLDPVDSVEKVLEVSGMADRVSGVMWLMAGPEAFDKIVVKTAPVTTKTVGGADQIEFKHARAGVVRITAKDGEVSLVELYADFGSTKSPTQRDLVSLDLKPVFEPWTFDTTPSKGQALEDRRKKKG